MMKITGLSHLFKWENLHNWWLTKYFFAPLYFSCVPSTNNGIIFAPLYVSLYFLPDLVPVVSAASLSLYFCNASLFVAFSILNFNLGWFPHLNKFAHPSFPFVFLSYFEVLSFLIL